MAANLDFSRHRVVFHNTEAVTYTSVRTNSASAAASVPDASFYERGTKEGAPSYGVYTKGLVRFRIRHDAIAGVGGAKPRDTIYRPKDGHTYTVLSASMGKLTRTWALDCVNLVLAADLRESGQLLRPSNTQDATGRASLNAYVAVATVDCRVQPAESSAGDYLERRTMPKRFTAFLASAVGAQAKDRFAVGAAVYTILAERNGERIDELPQLDLERIE